MAKAKIEPVTVREKRIGLINKKITEKFDITINKVYYIPARQIAP